MSQLVSGTLSKKTALFITIAYERVGSLMSNVKRPFTTQLNNK